MLKIVFWSEEDGCGITSGMAAVASVCADVWNKRTILMQSSNQTGDLCQKLGSGQKAAALMQAEDAGYGRDNWAYLSRLARGRKLTKVGLMQCMIPVVRGRMYYLPQGEYQKREKYPDIVKAGLWQVVCMAEQISDLTFVDCGSGRDEMSDFLMSRADVVVIGISQERQNLDAFFQNRHVFQGNVIYLVNQYQQESIYNKKNLNRLFRLQEEELAVIPGNPVFRHISGKGRTERFIRAYTKYRILDHQRYFMMELMQTAGLILKAAGQAV